MAIPKAREAVKDIEVEFKDNPYQVADGADAIVVATEWDEYRTLDLRELSRRMHTPSWLMDGISTVRKKSKPQVSFIWG